MDSFVACGYSRLCGWRVKSCPSLWIESLCERVIAVASRVLSWWCPCQLWRNMGLDFCKRLMSIMSASTKALGWLDCLLCWKSCQWEISLVCVMQWREGHRCQSRVVLWFRVGWTAICESERVFTLLAKPSCSWHLFMRGVTENSEWAGMFFAFF